MAQFNKNEVTLAKRKVRVYMYQSDGVSLSPWQTDWTGCVWVDQSTGSAIAAAGTFANNVRAFTFSAQTITAFPGSNNATIAGHVFKDADGIISGIGPVRLTTTGTLPTGLATNTSYYIIAVDVNTIAFATSRANAGAGTKITITGSGSGTITVVQDPSSPSLTTMPLNGSFTYTATQTETNYTGSEFQLRVEKTGMLTREVVVDMKDAGGFDQISEGSFSYGDQIRLCVAELFGKSGDYSTGTYSMKSMDGTKTRATHTADNTGRKVSTAVDLTP